MLLSTCCELSDLGAVGKEIFVGTWASVEDYLAAYRPGLSKRLIGGGVGGDYLTRRSSTYGMAYYIEETNIYQDCLPCGK